MAGKDGRSIIDVYKRQGTAQVDVEYASQLHAKRRVERHKVHPTISRAILGQFQVVCEAAARFSERIEFDGFTVPEAAEWARPGVHGVVNAIRSRKPAIRVATLFCCSTDVCNLGSRTAFRCCTCCEIDPS